MCMIKKSETHIHHEIFDPIQLANIDDRWINSKLCHMISNCISGSKRFQALLGGSGCPIMRLGISASVWWYTAQRVALSTLRLTRSPMKKSDHHTSIQGVPWLIKIRLSPRPTGYMLTSFGVFFIRLRNILKITLNGSQSLLKQGSGDFWTQPAKIRPFTTSTGFFRFWRVANLLPLIWTGQ